MCENKNHEHLNRWSKYDVTVGSAHARGGARDRRAAAGRPRLAMGLYRYFQLTDSLPDTKGPLAKKLTSSTIREANEAVRSVATKQSAKRGSYAKFTPEQQAEVAKYASMQCMALLLHSVVFEGV